MAKKSKFKPKYVANVVKPKAPGEYTLSDPYKEYQSTAQAPEEYRQTAVSPEAYTPGTYTSRYGDQLDSALDTVANWSYDPMKDASYQALAKVYGARGNVAAKNTLADAASLNGGYGTSYAVSAAQQARNQYNQELAALIPDLEANAFSKAQTRYNALRDAEDTEYGRWRDTEGDRLQQYNIAYQNYRDQVADERDAYNLAYNRYRDTEADNQWQYQMGYNAYRDTEADRQWLYSQNYTKYLDALDQYRWAKDWNMALYNYNHPKTGGGGSGGGRSGGGGGYYGGGGYTTTEDNSGGKTPTYDDARTSQIKSPGTTGGKHSANALETVKEKNKKSGGRIVK